MDFINQAMLYLLTLLHQFTHNYGFAIILLTVLIRAALWPLNSEQTRSMRRMQELQPKLKAMQDKHKDNPQKMQEQMMKFYAENKFNPFAGCLPLIVQLPIFIGLFGALNSPQFLEMTVNENFFFVDRLSHTLQSHAGEPLDNSFSVEPKDNFATANQVTIHYKSGEDTSVKVDSKKALKVSPTPLIPGEPVKFRFDMDSLGFDEEHISRIKSVDALVMNQKSKELEHVSFLPNAKERFLAEMPTTVGKNQLNTGVLILIVLYGVLTILYQRVMSPAAKKTATTGAPDPSAQMMKFMPLMFVGVLFFIPMPAGVLLYLVVTTALMFVQTALVNKQEANRGDGTSPPAKQVVDVSAD